MGVSNVYNQAKLNAIAALKRNISNQSNNRNLDTKAVYLTAQGSIFNAPGITDNITENNTNRSIRELNQRHLITPQENNNSKGNTFSTEEIAGIDNASDGLSAAKQVSAQGDQVKTYTSEVEEHGDTVRDFNDEAKDLRSNIRKDDKSFTSKLKQQEAQLKKDNDKLDKIIKENEETQLEVENAQNELDSLMATNSFSIGGENGTSSSNQERINELQVFIGSKVSLMQANGKMIYSLQRSSSRTLSKMKRTNAQYVKTQKKNTKNIQKQQTTTDKIINVATKIEQYSVLATLTGQTLDMSGQILVALGKAMSSSGWLAAVGAALIAAGTVMSKVGTVVEMVGQYGQAAANITKTAAYAADGNLMGAMQSAAVALQSGAAAVKSTTNLKNTFGEIDKRANEATQKLTADTVAKQQVKDMTKEELGGLSKKEARKALSTKLQNNMNLTENPLDAKLLLKDIKDGNLNEYKETIANIATEEINTFKKAVTEAGGKIENGIITGLSNEKIKTIKKQVTKKTVTSKTKNKTNSWTNKIEKFSKGLQTSAAIFSQYQNQNYLMNSGNVGFAPQWNLNNDPRFMKIARGNQIQRMYAT